MPPACIHLPRFRLAHPPNLDRPIIRRADDQRQRRVERRIVDPSIVPLQHVLDSREIVESLKRAWPRAGGGLAEAGDVPHAHGLVHRGGDDEVVLGVKLGGHHVVGVASQNGNAVARGRIPYADGLIVRAGELSSTGMSPRPNTWVDRMKGGKHVQSRAFHGESQLCVRSLSGREECTDSACFAVGDLAFIRPSARGNILRLKANSPQTLIL